MTLEPVQAVSWSNISLESQKGIPNKVQHNFPKMHHSLYMLQTDINGRGWTSDALVSGETCFDMLSNCLYSGETLNSN